MYIGEVVKLTGLSIKAIRLYEEKGLILAPPRKGRYRVYTATHIEVLKLIKEAKELGATLSQLQGVIVYHGESVDWERISQFLKEIKAVLINRLQVTQSQIHKVETCIATIDTCPSNLDSTP